MERVSMGFMPTIAMLLVQIGFAGNNLLSKMALDDGASPYVLIAYRSLMAAVFLAPFAVYFERNKWMMITRKVIIQTFLSSSFGMALSELLFFVGFQSTSATVACAIGNIVPALTFVIAAALRMEAVRLATPAGQAKVVGTLVCVGGSMIMPFYKGPLLKLWASPVHWRYAEHTTAAAVPPSSSGLGALLIILSAVAWAAWLVMQVRTRAVHGSISVRDEIDQICFAEQDVGGFLGAVQQHHDHVPAGLGGVRRRQRGRGPEPVGVEPRARHQALLRALHGGITFAVMTWCIQVRGPLFVSMFNPVVLIVVAVLGWGVLDEQLHVGSIVGSALIVGGLYMVLWGKGNEISRPAQLDGKSEAVISTKGLETNVNDSRNEEAHSLPV